VDKVLFRVLNTSKTQSTWKNLTVESFFGYFGAKKRLAPKYPAPKHDTLIVPFCGSASYAVHWADQDRKRLKVHLYEVYEPIVGIWEFLISASEEEIMNLPLCHEDGSPFTKQNQVPEYLPQEARDLIAYNLNKAKAVPYPYNQRRMDETGTKWVNDWSAGWSRNKRAKIARNLKYIRHWKIHNASYETAPNQVCSWMVDPPYQIMGKVYPCHDIDFTFLAEWCKSRRGQVIVCEQEGADWLPFQVFASHKGQNIRNSYNEMIWSNEPWQPAGIIEEDEIIQYEKYSNNWGGKRERSGRPVDPGSPNHQKPWENANMSRATWYRMRKEGLLET
jgi:site-specific DNA-adenine methylase